MNLKEGSELPWLYLDLQAILLLFSSRVRRLCAYNGNGHCPSCSFFLQKTENVYFIHNKRLSSFLYIMNFKAYHHFRSVFFFWARKLCLNLLKKDQKEFNFELQQPLLSNFANMFRNTLEN